MTTPLTFKDWRGTPMEIGSKVLVPYSNGSSVGIYEAEVTKIKPRVDYRYVYDKQLGHSVKTPYDTATVWVKSKNWKGEDEITVLRKFKNLTVLT